MHRPYPIHNSKRARSGRYSAGLHIWVVRLARTGLVYVARSAVPTTRTLSNMLFDCCSIKLCRLIGTNGWQPSVDQSSVVDEAW